MREKAFLCFMVNGGEFHIEFDYRVGFQKGVYIFCHREYPFFGMKNKYSYLNIK